MKNSTLNYKSNDKLGKIKVVFASNNKQKIEQVKAILNDFEVLSLNDVGITIDPEENGKTFLENAKIKAKAIKELINEIVIADDSGLCIDAFNGWPGVLTHRFLGKKVGDDKRNDYILEKMKNLPIEKRGAFAKCIIYVCGKNGEEFFEEGMLKGKIATEARGNFKFGFDEILEVEEGKTLAEFSKEEKIRFNARCLALEKIKIRLKIMKN